jgi:hypothetical protein
VNDSRQKMADELQSMAERLDAIRLELTDGRGTDEEVSKLARRFCDLDDDHMAKFFVEAARIMNGWKVHDALFSQAWYVGRHLARCECSTEDARALLREIVSAMELPRSGGGVVD